MVQIPQAELIPTQVRMDLLRAYVILLLLHEPFRRELDALYEEREKYPFLPKLPPEDTTEGIARVFLGDYFAFLVNERLPEEAEAVLLREGSSEWQLYQFYKRAYAFCSRWKLPAELWLHVLYLVFEVESLEDLRWWRENQPLSVGASSTLPQNLPTPPLLPEYNPLFNTRESYLEQVQQVVNKYCEQVEQAWRAAGWRGEQAFNHYRDPRYLQRLAKQVFMRVVLGMGWGAIRNALREEGVHIDSRASVKRTTERAIEILRITEQWESFFYRPFHQRLWQLQGDFEKLFMEIAERASSLHASP